MDRLAYAIKATSALSSLPLQAALLALKQWQGKETSISAMQRMGISYETRAPGPLIWFHASTFGECAVALPVLFRCLLEYNEKVAVMLTTDSVEAYNMLRTSLPGRVVVQMMPLDNAVCVSLFMRRWRPTVGIMVESPFSPQLVLLAAAFQVKLALINAHIEPGDLLAWHAKRHLRTALGNVLEKFALIIPQSDVDVGRFRIFGATMKQMPGWCNELKYAALMGNSVWHLWKPADIALLQLREALAGRPTWLAANTIHGEEEVVGRLHLQLAPQLQAARQPNLVTVIVPQDSGRCAEVQALLVNEMGLRVALWSMQEHNAYADMDILLVDDARQLPMFYRMCEVTLMGNSLVEGCSGHSLAQAAVAGTALLLGPHAGSSEHMAEELNNAAVMAAEDAAAAVRSTGQVMDDAGWEEPPSPSRSAQQTAGTADALADAIQQSGANASPRHRLQMEGRRLSQRYSMGSNLAANAGRPLTAPLSGHSSMLASHMSQYMPDSPHTMASDTDSMCSETATHHVVRHFFGSHGSGPLGAHVAANGSLQGSPRAPALPAAASATVPAGQSLALRPSQLPSPVRTSRDPGLATGAAFATRLSGSVGGSLPSSPAMRAASEMAGARARGFATSGGERWDRMFAAAQDASPWVEGTSSGSRATTPTAGSGRSAFSSAAAQVFSSPRSRPATVQQASGTTRRSASPASKGYREASTQTDGMSSASEAVGSGAAAVASTSLPLMMMAAMVGAMGGVQLATSPQHAQHLPHMAGSPFLNPHSNDTAQLPASGPAAATFLPSLNTLRGADMSMAGLSLVPLRSGSPVAGVTGGARRTSNGNTHPAASNCDSPLGSSTSSSFANDPVLNARSQKLKLKLGYSTWTATSTPDGVTPRTSTGTAPLYASPAVSGSRAPASTSRELMSALRAVAGDAPSSSGGSTVAADSHRLVTKSSTTSNATQGSLALAAPRNFLHSRSAESTSAWIHEQWGVEQDELEAGPELSSRSAPLLNRESFEFNFSPSFTGQHPGRQLLGGSPALQTASSMAAPAAGSNPRPSRLAVTSPPIASAGEHNLPTPNLLAPPPLSPRASQQPPWSPSLSVQGGTSLTMKAPSPATVQPSLNQHSSVNSSRSSAALFHSDPGSPSCNSQPSSSARSDRMWNRSDSGSPTNPAVRVSVAGWMGDFGMGTGSGGAAGAAALRGALHSAPAPSSSLPSFPAAPPPASTSLNGGPQGLAWQPDSNGASMLPLAQEAATSGAVQAAGSRQGVWFHQSTVTEEDTEEEAVSREVSLSPRPSMAEAPEDRGASLSGSGAGTVSPGSRSLPARRGTSRDSSCSNGTNGSLRSVRTPRATEQEPSRAWSNSTLPPASPRASLNTRTSFIPPPSPRASMEHLQWPGSGPSIAELQAMAANHRTVEDDGEESIPPETPTSRMSVLNGAASPFANSVFDRPNPFADSTGLPSRLDSLTAQALSDSLMAKLATQQMEWDGAGEEGGSQPATPTSRLSAMNSVTSPFSTSMFDRPNPFALDPADGLRTASSTASGAEAPAANRSGSFSANSIRPSPSRKASTSMPQQAMSSAHLSSSSAHPSQDASRPGWSSGSASSSSSGRQHGLAPVMECSAVLLAASLDASNASSTTSTPMSAAAASASFSSNLEDPGERGNSGRNLSRFFSQSARRRAGDAAAVEDTKPLTSHLSADSGPRSGGGASASAEMGPYDEQPETPRFRPRMSSDMRSAASSSNSSSWYHSTPQLHFTEQLFDASTSPRSPVHSSAARGTMPPESPRRGEGVGSSAFDLSEPLPSPLKTTPPPPNARLARRAAYQVRDTAQQCASFAPDATTALSILASAEATVHAMTSRGAAADATANGSDPTDPVEPLSPQSPYRRLAFGDNPNNDLNFFAPTPTPNSTTSQLVGGGGGFLGADPQGSNDSLTSDDLGPDLLTCLANVLAESNNVAAATEPQEEATGVLSDPSPAPAVARGPVDDRAQLLAATERLVSALEVAAAATGDGAASPAVLGESVGAYDSSLVQVALQDLLALLGPEMMRGSSGSGSLSTWSGSLGSFSSCGTLDQLIPADLCAGSSLSLREYSLRIQSLGMAAAIDAAVAMAGIASVMGASQADDSDAPVWDKLSTRVSNASVTLSTSGGSRRTSATNATLQEEWAAGNTSAGVSAFSAVGGSMQDGLMPPPDTAPLVVPSAHGPVLVAAPLALVTRLSLGQNGGSPTRAPSAASIRANSMEDILSALPTLPTLRLPQCTGSGGTSGAATARAGGAGPSGVRPAVTPYPLAPSSAPAHAAYARMPTLGDELNTSGGSSMRSESSDLSPKSTAPPKAAAPPAPLPQRAVASSLPASAASLFAFAAPVAAPMPSTTSSSEAGTPDAGHPIGMSPKKAGHSSPLGRSAAAQQQQQVAQAAPAAAMLGWQAAGTGGGWPASVAVQPLPDWQPSAPEDPADKAMRTRSNSLPHARAPTPTAQANGSAAAYSAVNPAAALAHKVAGASASAAPSTSSGGADLAGRTGRTASAQPQQEQQQQTGAAVINGRVLGRVNAPQASLTNHNSRPSSQQQLQQQQEAHVPAPSHQPFVLPATQLSRSTGPAVWHVGNGNELAGALLSLLGDPLERRSRGHAAAQAAAKLASGLVNTVWHVLDDTVITPALHGYVQTQTPGNTAVGTHRA